MPGRGFNGATGVNRTDLDTKVAKLKQTATYPDNPFSVNVVETHMSWVFLTDRYAYKLKKPVRYDFLDYSTLQARRDNCDNELRLNRRLAPDVYLTVVALSVDPAGELVLEQQGDVVEWLVKMRRLPAQRMLDYLIVQQELCAQDLDAAATMLARFYKASAPVRLDGKSYLNQLREDMDHNLQELSRGRYQLPMDLIDTLRGTALDLLRRDRALFEQRAADGNIVEGHGDLRPEHICLEAKPVIFDCLEFNRRFRIVDTIDELAFLAMECDRLGAPFVGEEFFRIYRLVTGDDPAPSLVYFYKAARACLRAKLAIWHTRELEESQWAKWRDLAIEYLRLAAGYAQWLS
jgi:aminoglycoside phosphotransferase family enzyme